MIKHAVRRHFDGVDDTLVTNYFDKLIQVPIRVPPAWDARSSRLHDAAICGEQRTFRFR